jgi:cysteine-rich repeat protein
MQSRACSIIAILMAIGCGSGTKPNTPGYGGATGEQCHYSASCLACITQNCDSEAMTAFGGGYMNNRFNGGQCPNFMACTCNTTGKENICAQQDGANCVAAFNTLGACLDATACFNSECKNNNGNGSGGNGGNGGSPGIGGSTGTGGAVSALSVSPSALAFGAVAVGAQSAPLQITVVGTGAADIQGIPAIVGSVSFEIFGAPSCASATMCVWQICFVPLYAGAFSATLTVGNGSYGRVLLTGTGVASGSAGGAGGIGGTGGSTGAGGTTGATLGLVVDPTSVDFGAVTVGGVSTVKTVTITGIKPFVVNPTIAGSSFEIQNTTCGGATTVCMVSIVFLPLFTGPAAGMLVIDVNANVTLTGVSVVPSPFTASSSMLPATLVVGQSIPVSVTVTAAGTITDLSCLPSGADLTVNAAMTTCTEMLANNSSCVYAYTFKAAKFGAMYDTISCAAGGMVRTIAVSITVLASGTAPDAGVADSGSLEVAPDGESNGAVGAGGTGGCVRSIPGPVFGNPAPGAAASPPGMNFALCGNGVHDLGEDCDDGNTVSGDGCSSGCQYETGFICAERMGWPSSVCNPRCGDGYLVKGEVCDCGDGTEPVPLGCPGPNNDATYGGCTTQCTYGLFCGG